MPIFKSSTHNWAQWLVGGGRVGHITQIHLALAYSYTHAQKAPKVWYSGNSALSGHIFTLEKSHKHPDKAYNKN